MRPEDRRPADGHGTDELVQFLLRETGDQLFFVLQYDVDDWHTRYLSSVAERFLAETSAADIESMLQGLRQGGRANTQLASTFDVGTYYCSLHLFGGLVMIHFFRADAGVIFGFDPAAASHLTDFVSLTIPYVRDAGLEGLRDDPAWESR